LGLPTDLVEQVVPMAGLDLTIVRPRDSEALLDEHEFADDEFLPYWADLWPSAELLARTVVTRALRGARVLELGCGLGLPSLAAAAAGGRVLATDWAPHAVEAVQLNAERNEIELETLVCDWQEPAALLERGPWDLVLAADVLYEQRNVAPLRELLLRLACETWLADPGRAPADTLLADLDVADWTHLELARTAQPRVTVHRLLPPVY
jgi:predicted nicotinamide N-methyase